MTSFIIHNVTSKVTGKNRGIWEKHQWGKCCKASSARSTWLITAAGAGHSLMVWLWDHQENKTQGSIIRTVVNQNRWLSLVWEHTGKGTDWMFKRLMGNLTGQFTPWVKLCPSKEGLVSTKCFKCQKVGMPTGNMRGPFLGGDQYSLLTYTFNHCPHYRWARDTLELSVCQMWAERRQQPTSGNGSSTPALPLSPVSPLPFSHWTCR